MITQPLILIVDDEPAILQTLKESLEDEHYRVKTLSDGNKALEAIGDIVPDLVLLDIFMPNCNGIALLERIKKEYPQQKVIMISGFGNIPMALNAIKKGALDFIEKPLNLDDVLSKIELIKKSNYTNTDQLQSPTPANDHNTFGLVGQSPLFLEFVQQVRQLAPLKHPLLIYGAIGTGKTLTAHYAHHIITKNKPNMPFFLFNCSAKLDDFNQQLDTIRTGTLFFKNINNLSAEHQRELLHFLASNTYKENNANGTLKIIASSYQSLFKLSLENVFNHALLHKLNLTPLELVTLNKRRYDIPLLCNYFLTLACTFHGKKISFSTQSIRFLRNHNWNGNIAELKAFINTIVAQTQEATSNIEVRKLIEFLHEKNTHLVEEQAFLHFSSLQEATETFERHFLAYSLKKSRFDVQQVSDRLQISLDELQNKLCKLNISSIK